MVSTHGVPSWDVLHGPQWRVVVATAVTFVYAGPVAPGPLTVVLTVVHVAAACSWTGGLAALAVALVPTGATADLADALDRFALLAPACVVALVATGTLHAWLRAGSVAELVSSGYGRVFWLKVAAVAGGNRRYVGRYVRPAGRPCRCTCWGSSSGRRPRSACW